ncbi:hypothetical protein CEXT_114871 [Caerostris extrusa]|uniref:Uncharacterized protein n=1 Tax=Caerostris extrusa TaxID=172846 RepID=A0AAV4SJ13_CAEEX|nr:hypothetical protein CEXT_114871 [Caerostris extrusa]
MRSLHAQLSAYNVFRRTREKESFFLQGNTCHPKDHDISFCCRNLTASAFVVRTIRASRVGNDRPPVCRESIFEQRESLVGSTRVNCVETRFADKTEKEKIRFSGFRLLLDNETAHFCAVECFLF